MKTTSLSDYCHTLFDQLQTVLAALSDAEYSTANKVILNASIGQHVRHVIELFAELEKGYTSGVVNYDNRERNLLLETDKAYAAEKLQTVLNFLQKSDKPLTVLANFYGPGNESEVVASNYSREILYNIEHTVHHLALIRVALQTFPHIVIPMGFGIAASTIRYKKECAQ